jgi:hypothetical protein
MGYHWDGGTPPSHEQRQMGTSGTSGTSSGSGIAKPPQSKGWYTDETYYRQIIWNMGEQISQLKEENKTLQSQIQGIQKLLGE